MRQGEPNNREPEQGPRGKAETARSHGAHLDIWAATWTAAQLQTRH